ncbi:MAG: family 78 glycoside hydrolase catalytic domain [Bryobacterales bacterium]|nr:family 78 glycoside hydrolase catalytic domain [Bryobacterales bacterium]
MKRSVLLALFSAVVQASAALVVQNLQVEYGPTPLGIDVAQPRFSWQMAATAGERDQAQSAYQIQVREPGGKVVWDTGRVESPVSLGIRYAGSPLQAATRYSWTVTTWTQPGARLTASSWFETGLMDPAPDSSAWGGARWIGGGNEDLVLYAPYLVIFNASYAVAIAPGSTRASFVYGANDSRLMDRNKNIYQLQNGRDQSYIKLELDISAVDGTPDGRAKLHVYRAGYQETDTPTKPLRTFDISAGVINNANKHAEHVVAFRSAFGQIGISIDGNTSFAGAAAQPSRGGGPGGPPAGFGGRGGPANSVNLNPAGLGWDYLPFGMLCEMGFSVDPGQNATFRDVTIRNSRAPGNILFREDLTAAPYQGVYASAVTPGSGFSVAGGRYVLSGGARGVFVVRDPSRNSAPMLRTTFKTSGKAVRSARLYVTARGIYEVYLNGSRVGTDYYNPGLTQYNITHMYQTYDVTSLVKAGENAIGAMLGEGWWSGLLSFGDIWNHFGDRQSLLARLVITYRDGSSDTVVTDPLTWKYFGGGPLVYGSLDFGEIYDAARESAVDGWTTAGYDDSRWKSAVVVPLKGATFSGTEAGRGGAGVPFTFDKLSLIGQVGDNAGVFRTLTAKSVREVRPGVYVYDMGQNIVGVPRITIASGRAGAKVTLRYSEMLYPDLKESGGNVGMIMTENYRAALSQDVYTMKAGRQVYQPRFTSHGYQYIEITGTDKPLPLAAVEGVAISSVRQLAADYRTSNEKVNRLWSNLVWSNVGNFLTIPTDCPQRNERMGWSGDINVFSRTATYVSNADQFLTRHLYAMRDTQSPAGRFADIAPVGGGFGGVLWGSAGIVVPWEVYLQYNDVGLLQQHYPAMAAYLDYLETTVDPATGFTSDGQLGDWLGPQNNLLGTPFLTTAYHAYNLGIMAQAAEVLGKSGDAVKYRGLYEKRKAFFNAVFVNPDRKTLAAGGGRGGFGGGGAPAGAPGRGAAAAPEFRLADTQTSYAVGLGMGLFNDRNTPQMIRNLADAVERETRDDAGVLRPKYSLMTGFIGTSWISKALSDHGLSEQAYRLLLNDRYPSWLYAVDQGATTIWERLNGYTVENGFGGNNSMNSFNHYSFGAVGQWMMAYSLGIQRGEPGFRKFILQPEPDPTGVMTWAEGHYDSMYGRISSAWKVEGNVLTCRATVPANTTATLYLPAKSAETVREGGRAAASANGVSYLRYENGKAVYSLKSGAYEFTANR